MTNRFRLTRRGADAILDDPASAASPVARVLAAAAAPAEGDVPGLAEATAQFRAAADGFSAEGVSMVTRIRRALAAPAVALSAAGVLLAGGGVALAASQGALHVPFTGHDNRSENAPDAPSSTNPGIAHTGGPSDVATPSAHGTPNGSPTPSFEGLCHAYRAGAYQDDKKSPAFAALAAKAGGAEGVNAFCTTLLGPTPTHPAQPTRPAKPTQAAEPTKPAKPTQAAEPTQAAHPTKAAKPTQAAEPTLPEPAVQAPRPVAG